MRFVVLVVLAISIISSHLKHTVCNEILASTVGLYNSFNQIFRNVSIVGKKLLGILRQAVATITKRRIVILVANTRVKADALDDLLSIQALHLSVGIQLIEVGDTQSKISIGKQLDSLGLGKAHNERVDVLLNRAFLQQPSKGVSCLHKTSILHIGADNDSARIEVVIQSLGFTQELRAEDDIVTVVLLTHRSCKANRNRGLDDHDSIRIILNHQLDDSFHCRSIKEVLLAVIVGRCCNDDEVSVFISCLSV